MYLGLMAIDKYMSMENMALALDLCAKFCLLVKNNDNKWKAVPGANGRQCIFIGDIKTVNCLNKGIRYQERKPPSSKVTSSRSDVFCNVINWMHIRPGD